jgi:chromosome segregation ATPase
MTTKDRFSELEKKVQQIAERLATTHALHSQQQKEIERLRKVSQQLEQEIMNLKKEREQVKNKVERILNAINRVSGE